MDLLLDLVAVGLDGGGLASPSGWAAVVASGSDAATSSIASPEGCQQPADS